VSITFVKCWLWLYSCITPQERVLTTQHRWTRSSASCSRFRSSQLFLYIHHNLVLLCPSLCEIRRKTPYDTVAVLWVVNPWSLVGPKRFGVTCCLHIQGRSQKAEDVNGIFCPGRRGSRGSVTSYSSAPWKLVGKEPVKGDSYNITQR
jgi:hypothetical protein